MLSEEVRHACTNHYKFSPLMSLRSRDMSRPNTLALVVIHARMSDLLWYGMCYMCIWEKYPNVLYLECRLKWNKYGIRVIYIQYNYISHRLTPISVSLVTTLCWRKCGAGSKVRCLGFSINPPCVWTFFSSAKRVNAERVIRAECQVSVGCVLSGGGG